MRYATDPLHEITAARGTLLYDLENDPSQETSLHDSEVELQMTAHAKRIMAEIDAPGTQYERVGWTVPQ